MLTILIYLSKLWRRRIIAPIYNDINCIHLKPPPSYRIQLLPFLKLRSMLDNLTLNSAAFLKLAIFCFTVGLLGMLAVPSLVKNMNEVVKHLVEKVSMRMLLAVFCNYIWASFGRLLSQFSILFVSFIPLQFSTAFSRCCQCNMKCFPSTWFQNPDKNKMEALLNSSKFFEASYDIRVYRREKWVQTEIILCSPFHVMW